MKWVRWYLAGSLSVAGREASFWAQGNSVQFAKIASYIPTMGCLSLKDLTYSFTDSSWSKRYQLTCPIFVFFIDLTGFSLHSGILFWPSGKRGLNNTSDPSTKCASRRTAPHHALLWLALTDKAYRNSGGTPIEDKGNYGHISSFTQTAFFRPLAFNPRQLHLLWLQKNRLGEKTLKINDGIL